jgi:hypothetical protein
MAFYFFFADFKRVPETGYLLLESLALFRQSLDTIVSILFDSLFLVQFFNCQFGTLELLAGLSKFILQFIQIFLL